MTDRDLMEIAAGVVARVVPGAPFAERPEVRMDSLALVLRPAGHVPPEPGADLGSLQWLWNDAEDWRFDARSGGLDRIVVGIPEVTAPESELTADWADTPATVGTLQLLEPRDFLRPEATTRWCDPAGDSLLIFYAPVEPSAPPAGARRRVRLAEGTHLLVLGEELVGWSIDRPARFITGERPGTPIRDEDTDAELGRLLSGFFALVTVDGVERLDDGDAEVRDALLDLDRRLEPLCARDEPRAVEIRVRVRQVLEDFGG